MPAIYCYEIIFDIFYRSYRTGKEAPSAACAEKLVYNRRMLGGAYAFFRAS